MELGFVATEESSLEGSSLPYCIAGRKEFYFRVFLRRPMFYTVAFFLVSYVEERPRWPIQSPKIGRKKKANS